MGNIECILDEVNNLSDSDLKIIVNKIMDRLKLEKAFASPAKFIPRMECPVCHTNAHVVRNGHKHGKQAFLCRACGKSYVTTSNTLLACSHYSSVVWKTVLADTLMGVSLDDTRDGLKLRHIKISHTSLFFMRHKTMLALEDLQEISPAMIEDVVEADETHVPESEKGGQSSVLALRENPVSAGLQQPSAVFLTSRSASALQFSVKAAIWL